MNEEKPEESIHQKEEPVKFGYGASIVFLIFIAFVIYFSVKS